jgi:hypothetical protein
MDWANVFSCAKIERPSGCGSFRRHNQRQAAYPTVEKS